MRSTAITTKAPTSARWICSRCAVSVGQADGHPTAVPETWSESEDGSFCLTCSRAIAGEAALDSAPADSTHADKARLRRTGVIEFELHRTPEATDRRIAEACRTSRTAVVAVRGRDE
jgi:hypothetical protein